jgi:NAD kinase
MPSKIVGLYVDSERDNARAVGNTVADVFRARGYEVRSNGDSLAGAQLLVTIGGDGLTIEERVALQVEYDGTTYFALNDAVVRKGSASRMVPFGLNLGGEQAAHIPADGICVCTPTGSTAYFLSAGGSIISPKVEAFGIVPLLPHTLFSRPIIVPTTSRIEISCDSEIVHANLECDGDTVAELAPGASVYVTRHPKLVRFARFSSFRFFERLEEKLRWGVSIKNAQGS